VTRKQIKADQQIQKAPHEVHERGGVADTVRFGEGCRKGSALQPCNEMRDAIAKKSPGKESGDVVHEMT
jgi:hypothetical protein